MNKFIICLIVMLVVNPIVFANDNEVKSPRFIVHLLDYLAKDYSGAVSDNGKVISKSEYSEQIEFAQSVLNASENIAALHSNQTLQKK